MSILASIMSSVLGGRAAPPPPVSSPSMAERPVHPAAAAEPQGEPQRPQPTQPSASSAPSGTAGAQVDVAAVLDKLAQEAKEKLDWRTSIVDLMKLLKLDSGLAARKTLAKELNFTGNTKDSAAMNLWLHKQVMAKLAQSGGKVPADLIRH